MFRLKFNDERTKRDSISTELAVHFTKIAKLKQRYETFYVMFNADKSDEESIAVQAQFIIKACQQSAFFLVIMNKHFYFNLVCTNERRFIKTRRSIRNTYNKG